LCQATSFFHVDVDAVVDGDGDGDVDACPNEFATPWIIPA
jgi:hypothetical protein